MLDALPVVVVGAGPIGLAAASHLVLRGLPAMVLEAGPRVGTNVRDWSHVRLFSVWNQCVDDAARELLEQAGWAGVPEDQLPTGGDLVQEYLEPLAAIPTLRALIETDTRVTRITRQHHDRMSTKRRSEAPFVITVESAAGHCRNILARAVIDTSGTWQNPNPLGASGWPADGEQELRPHIRYGMPDVNGADREIYAGRRTAVIGGGHSAANALLDLALLAEREPATSMTWIVRGKSLATVFGGGDGDRLPARGVLGQRIKALTEQGRLQTVLNFATESVVKTDNALMLTGTQHAKQMSIGPFDRIIAATGQRPDFSFARELQLDLHPAVESTRQLGPLIDPNFHSCGTVPPHGWRELAHAEPNYFVAGVKSYGRAPTFLLLTGYEQVRSIVAHLAGDAKGADDVRLVLPETGICNATLEQVAPGTACCQGAEPHAETPCCDRPEEEKASICCAGPQYNKKVSLLAKASSCCN